MRKEKFREKIYFKGKRNIYIFFLFFLLIILMSCFVIFHQSHQKVVLEILDYETGWTNESILLTVKKVKNALYSFNGEEYSSSNIYEVDSNIEHLLVRMKVQGKEYQKEISISNIDKEAPIIHSALLEDSKIKVDAIDSFSGIKQYIYIIDGVQHSSKENSFVLEKETKDIEIQVIDYAGNSIFLPKTYFENETLTYTLSTESWTNKGIILTVLKKPDFVGYSFSYSPEKILYRTDNSFEITKNGSIYLSVKTGSQELKKTIEIRNIDYEKPIVSYQLQNGIVKISATDNSNDTLLYSWNGGKFESQSEKAYQKNAKKQVVRVKDCAGNISTIVFDVVLPSFNTAEDNKTPSDNPSKSTPTPTNQNKPRPTENQTSSGTTIRPTFDIQYSESGPTTNPITITVLTDTTNLISFQGGPWTSNKSIVIYSNVKDYIIRVKNKVGNISEKTIHITNILKEKTTREKNQDMISQINSRYGFKVSYGDGTYCYYAGSSCTPLYNEEKANKALTTITNLLEKFPNDFFRKFQGNNGYRIVLFDDIPGNTQGVTSYEIGNDNQMFLDVNNGMLLERVIYHETWHFMEQLILIKNNYNNPFDSNWNQLNPNGFSYSGDSSNTYTPYDSNRYSPGFPIANIAFISVYGKSSAQEDRAEIFADLMFRGYKQTYMQIGYGINEKAKAMMQEVRKIWTDSPTATWEKYIAW